MGEPAESPIPDSVGFLASVLEYLIQGIKPQIPADICPIEPFDWS